MSRGVSVAGQTRMQRQVVMSARRRLGVGVFVMLAVGIAVGSGWWWRVATVYQDVAQVQAAVRTLEQGLAGRSDRALTLATDLRSIDADVASGAADSHVQGPSGGGDDVSALVRWHDLLREHQLHDWQGRTVPSTELPASPANPSDGGAVWRLEGTATYEQGVALLRSMVQSFPRLVLLRVQVQQSAKDERLQWRLELRWSASLPALAYRWPAGGAFDTEGRVNPFAWDRMRVAEVPKPPLNNTDFDPGRVLPQASLEDIRLVGVLEGEHERWALVAMAETAQTSAGPKPPRGWRSHRLRLGQTLGVEQARVVSIESRSVVLQASRERGTGRRQSRDVTLALISLPDASGDGGTRP
jgi:Tfp pilus assembly protein PilP